jgi:hypothetical protein
MQNKSPGNSETYYATFIIRIVTRTTRTVTITYVTEISIFQDRLKQREGYSKL